MAIISKNNDNELKFEPLDKDGYELASYCEKLRLYRVQNIDKITKICI